MMRKIILAAAAVAALASQAFAADMAVKALPAPSLVGYPYNASGLYFGVGASSTAQNASVANTGVLSLGAGLDGIVGYQWKGGLDFIAIEGDFTWTNLGNSAACATVAGTTGCSLSSQFEVEPKIKVGFPIAAIQQILPNLAAVFPALPTLPANFVPLNQHPYIFVGMPIRDVSANYGLSNGREWTIQAEGGLGILNQWTNGVAVDVSAGATIGNSGFTVGPINEKASLGLGFQTRIAVLY